jgi:hypothetical protein
MRRFLSSTATATLVIAAALAAATETADAQSYSLAGDWSDVSNPNGVWSYTQGTTPLTHYPQPTDGNALNAAAGAGHWGVGSTFASAPFLFRTTAAGSTVAGYNDGDFLAGDVIVHSTNPNSGAPVFINWTAPGAGTISFAGSLWYAHSPVTRANTVTALLNGASLGSVVTAPGVTRSAAVSLSGTGLSVGAGDVLAFRFDPVAGQSFGSLTGIDATIRFAASSAVPEPATWAMMIVGFAAVGGSLRRRGAARTARIALS